jgi:hypothetical protein
VFTPGLYLFHDGNFNYGDCAIIGGGMKDQFPKAPTREDWKFIHCVAREAGDRCRDELNEITADMIVAKGREISASCKDTPPAIRQFYKRLFLKRNRLPDLTDEQFEMLLGSMSLDPDFEV